MSGCNFHSGHMRAPTSLGMPANMTSRNMALKRCILGGMVAPQPTPGPAALPSLVSLYWGGFFRHRGVPLTLCRLCATNLITGIQGSPPQRLPKKKRPAARLVYKTRALSGWKNSFGCCSRRTGSRPLCPARITATEREERRRGAEVGGWQLCLQGAGARSSTSVCTGTQVPAFDATERCARMRVHVWVRDGKRDGGGA